METELFFKWQLTYRSVGPGNIVRPSPQTRIDMRKNAEAHLRSKYAVGTYSDPTICNEILKHIFSFYEKQFDDLLPLIATSRWVGEVLFQYEESGKVTQAFKLGELSDDDYSHWAITGATFRQSLDIICEKLAAITEIDKVSGLWETQIPDFEKVLLCAEKCVEYGQVSNYTFMVIPHATSININPLGSDPYFEHIIADQAKALIDDYHKQNNREVTLRDQYMEISFDPFDHQYHASILNEPPEHFAPF